MKGLTDIPGILVGHASDTRAITGCTAILCERGAVAGVDIGGFATGTSELDVLNPLHITPSIHGICFAGRSAFGLEASSGVRRFLEKKGIGFSFGNAKIPIVPSAIIFDLGLGDVSVRPTREMGFAAAEAATDGPVAEGCVGAGTGATVGKALGLSHAMKSGIGSFSTTLSGNVKVGALAVVNALGDVIHPGTGNIVAGTRTTATGQAFANSSEVIKKANPPASTGNTTLVAVATNAALTKVQATRLAQLGQHGLVRAISPVHTISDGDLVIALSTGQEKAEFRALGIAVAEVVAEAIVRAVLASWTLGGVPGLAPAKGSR